MQAPFGKTFCQFSGSMLNILKKSFFAILFFFLMAVGVEVLLGAVFFVKDYNIEPMAVKDYPYLYYLFQDTGDEINQDGFKTTATRKKDENKVRIMVMGGSVARGREPEHTISRYLEKELKDRLDSDRIEVINAGVSAFVLEQEFILTQTILQRYKPEIILGVDGYNDLLTFKLNRFQESDFPLPPHNWQDFQVIRNNRADKSFTSRFTHFFRYITRAVRFVQRSWRESNFSWQQIPASKLDATAQAYSQVMEDINMFCLSKGILYRNFLQPLRYYPPGSVTKELSTEEQKLADLYKKFEIVTKQKPYGFSLTGLFDDQKEVYRDDCHVSKEGHQKIAREMADQVETDIRELLFMKPKEFMDIRIH